MYFVKLYFAWQQILLAVIFLIACLSIATSLQTVSSTAFSIGVTTGGSCIGISSAKPNEPRGNLFNLITGDEMFTDSSKYKVIDDCLYEVECRHVQRKLGDVQLEGSNPSQEEADEGTEDVVESGLDLVLNQRLIETGFSKNDFKNYLKTYTKSLQEKWKEMGKSDAELAEAKSKFTEAVKKVLPKIGDLQFFMGESSNPDGLIALLEYRENDAGDETPIMIFFKHGLEEEKV